MRRRTTSKASFISGSKPISSNSFWVCGMNSCPQSTLPTKRVDIKMKHDGMFQVRMVVHAIMVSFMKANCGVL